MSRRIARAALVGLLAAAATGALLLNRRVLVHGPDPRAGTDTTFSIAVAGRVRRFLVHVPKGYLGTDMPAVLNFHGWGSNAHQQLDLSGMNAIADREGFIVAYPEGTGTIAGFNAGGCCGEALAGQVDDVAFVRELVAKLDSVFKLDRRRLFATGMSNGGFMAHRLGCEMSDVFAGIAPVAGVMGMPSCTPSHPVSVLQFHGTADPLVGYRSGGLAVFTSVEDTVRDWAKRDRCPGLAAGWASDSRRVTFERGDVRCETYTGCAQGTEVGLCRIDGGGHTWPGGPPVPQFGKTTTEISATEAMWSFFVRHPKGD